MKTINLIVIVTTALLVGYGCAFIVPALENDRAETEAEQPEEDTPDLALLLDEYAVDFFDLTEEEQILFSSRSRLSDQFATLNHDMPDFFFEEMEEEEVDIYQGFRVQILSTRSVGVADSTLIEFEEWTDSTFTDFFPRGYIHFRQPYYRVRIGDFHDRERAIELAQMLKFRYPDAWVVHDRINPYRVPSDTLEFRREILIDRME